MSIEGKSTPPSFTAPSWYPPVNDQIRKASVFLELHGGKEGYRPSDIPAIPNFTPRTRTEVLLLTVMLPNKGYMKGFRRTFDSWWDFIVPPSGLTKWRWQELKSNSKRLRLAKGIEYKPGIRWVAFDPYAYQSKSPKQALALSVNDDTTTLAHAEVLMAAAMFPDWVDSWDNRESPYPNLSGFQFWNSGWNFVLALRSSPSKSMLGLDAVRADSRNSSCSSPTIREC